MLYNIVDSQHMQNIQITHWKSFTTACYFDVWFVNHFFIMPFWVFPFSEIFTINVFIKSSKCTWNV